MQATFIYADHPPYLNSSQFRALIPAKYLRLAGHDITEVQKRQVDLEHIFSTVLVERELSVSEIVTLRAYGAKRIIYTFDDAYRLLPNSGVGPHQYWKGSQRHLNEFGEVCRQVDLSIVPSRLLARECRAAYVPNYHDPDLWPDYSVRDDSRIRIGWGGSTQHRETWHNMKFAAALRRVLDESPEVDLIVCAGVADEALSISGCRFKSIGWMTFEKWPEFVRSLDIGIAPLHTEYDFRRSNLKLMEYGLAGIPFVATEAGEYCGLPGGLLVENDEKSWHRALSALVKSSSRRADLGAKGRRWAERYLMPNHIKEYEDILWPTR